MKLARTLLAIALAVSVAPVAGCGKSSDLGQIEHEANGLVKMFDRKLTLLQQRRQTLSGRKDRLAGMDQEGAGIAQRDFDAAGRRLDELRKQAAAAPGELAAAAKSANGRTALLGKMGELKRELSEGFTIVNSAYGLYESYLTRVESKQTDVASAEPTKDPAEQQPPPPPPGSTGDPADRRSPPTPSGDLPASSSTQGGPSQKVPAGGN